MVDLISRQAAIDEIESDAEFLKRVLDDTDIVGSEREKFAWGLGLFESLIEDIKGIPSAQLDRDIPRKPIEGCSLSGRKKIKEASCRNCNYFLSHYHFYGEGKRITYCEHCGQAIDWEGWEWDE